MMGLLQNNRASSIEHRASSIEHRASSIEHRASSIEHRASSIEHQLRWKAWPDMRRGFTLIELSIVLVVIGLIIGGVLVGREMIIGAQVRNQVSDIESYNSAVMIFKLK